MHLGLHEFINLSFFKYFLLVGGGEKNNLNLIFVKSYLILGSWRWDKESNSSAFVGEGKKIRNKVEM